MYRPHRCQIVSSARPRTYQSDHSYSLPLSPSFFSWCVCHLYSVHLSQLNMYMLKHFKQSSGSIIIMIIVESFFFKNLIALPLSCVTLSCTLQLNTTEKKKPLKRMHLCLSIYFFLKLNKKKLAKFNQQYLIIILQLHSLIPRYEKKNDLSR